MASISSVPLVFLNQLAVSSFTPWTVALPGILPAKLPVGETQHLVRIRRGGHGGAGRGRKDG